MHTTSTTSAGLAARSSDIEEFANRLRSISERARKLLVHIAELAYHGRGQQRKPDVAYLPELYESCGLGVEEMYPLLSDLKAAGLIEVEDQYPFEDIRILPVASGWHVVAALSQFAERQKISLRDLLVDLRFELLQ
jgi:hypothetical protein